MFLREGAAVGTTRRTQAERSAGTQAVLVAAAVDCLVERGWAATTAVEVCRRAGVTRGALLHHFPDLPGLLARALESLYDEFAARAEPAATLAGEVDRMWGAVAHRRFKAVLEAWLAAANDADLAVAIGPVVARFAKLVAPPEVTDRGPEAEAFLLLAREAVLGLGLGRATNGGRALRHEAAVLDQLRDRARELDR